MTDLQKLWKQYNKATNKLADALCRTNNIVGEYAEHLALQYYGGKLLNISGQSADIKSKNGKLIKVKSRRIKSSSSAQLNIIRSWDFDILFVVLFDRNGDIVKAIQVPMEVAKEYGKANKHQRGYVITTTQAFLNDKRNKDLTTTFA